ncbi:CAP domain-containing protein [Pyrenochaeta sp. MPI-SDFR-AT-0127]|nr:CAP domain-containing protein [Pyrenochaeta sp. MPI-SDFR-AT-0127]
MRSSILLASALAMGALASPKPTRRKGNRIVTETELVILTVTVTVTEGYPEPPASSVYISTTPQEPAPTEASSVPAAPPSSTTTPTPAPVPSPEPEPTSFELVSSLIPTSTPSVETQPGPDPEPTSAEATKPSSSTTQASVPTISAGSHISGADQAYLSSGPDYQAAVLYHHNVARANHGAAPLTWDADCEAAALLAAKTCIFEHYIPDGVRQGQNLFTVSGEAFNVTAGITESWYKGELEPMMPYFGQNDIPDDVFHSVGHLTQMVWKDTTKVGCVSLDCGANMIVGGVSSTLNKYTVCNYAAPGNVAGGYAENVAAPISTTNLGSWAD